MNLKTTKSNGRDVLDSIAESRAHLNPEMFYTAEKTPIYLYGVQNVVNKLKFDTAKKDKNTKYPLIYDIVSGVTVMALRDEDSYVQFVDDEGTIIDTVPAHPKIVTLIKVCIAASVNSNEDYSKVVSAFVREILSKPDNISIPVTLPEENKYQKILGESLNAYLAELCEEHSIKSSEVIDAPKKSKKTKNLFDTIGLVNG